MRIAIVRGPFLNKFEMQSYEPLRKKHDIIAYHTNKHFFDTEIIDLPMKSFRTPEGLFGHKFLRTLSLPSRFVGRGYQMLGLERELKDRDIIHTAETYWYFSLQCVEAKKKYGTKVVLTEWENIPFVEDRHPLRKMSLERKIKEKIAKNTDLFVAVTQKTRDVLILEGTPPEKIEVIPVGVHLDKFSPSTRNPELLSKMGIQEDDTVILFVGRLVWEKGGYSLLYSMKMLLNDGISKVKVIFCGSGPEEKALQDKADALGISKNMIFLGSVPYPEMPQIYGLADVFTLLSIPTKNWQEQFGMVLVEAMACGKPVVSTLNGSIPEVVGDAGILIPPDDPSSLFEILKNLIQDEAKRRELGKTARKRAEKEFDSRKIADRLEKAYERIY